MKFVRICSLALALLLCLSVTGCGGGTEQPASTAEASPAAAGDAPGATAASFNATGFPIVNEPVTLTVYGARDANHAEWKDVFVLRKYEEMTGVHIDYQEVPATLGAEFDEKKNLLFASNELPDIFLRCDLKAHEVGLYGVTSGQLMPLDSLMEQYAPNLMGIYEENPIIYSSMKASDGQIYTVPGLDFSNTGMIGFKQWINKDWLAAVNKEVPTTLDELKDVLIAFRDGDPNGNGEADEIPLGIREPNSVFTLAGSFGLQWQMGEPCNIDENGQIHFWLADDAFKEYLQFLNGLYAEKLIWQDYYKNDRPAWRSNLANALYGAFYMPYSDVFLNVEEQFVGFEPLPGPNGDRVWSDANAGINPFGAFAISSTCAYPEVAMRWVDYFFSDEGSLFFAYGVEGETYTMDEAGMPRFPDEVLNAEEGFMTALGRINLVPGKGFPALTNDQTDGTVASDLTKEVSAMMAPFVPEKIYTKPSVGAEDNERVNAIDQDLINYRDESATKFIIGEWSFDEWDEYCKALEQIGLYEKEEILQRALDAQRQ